MSRTRQLSDLILDTRKRADVESALVRHPDADITEYLNQSIADLRDQLVRAHGSDWLTTETSYPGDGTSTLFGHQADFYTLISVRLDLGSHQRIPLDPFTEIEEARYESIPNGTGLFVPKYRLREANLEVLPAIQPGQTLWVKYTKAAPRLVNNTDTFDGYNGWEEFVILDAARKVATKDRMWDLVGQLKGDIQKIEMRIAALASKRDRGRPERVQDTRSARRYARLARWRMG